jgi:DNA adenine methylase
LFQGQKEKKEIEKAVETYNDLDGEVVNFFRVLRDRQEALIRTIGLTRFSREELHVAAEEPIEEDRDLNA